MAEYQNIDGLPLELWPLDKIKPYEKNNKVHEPESVRALADSIADVGVENPILVEEDGTIISGHGRREALILLGREMAHVRVARGLSKAQARKLRIAANKTASSVYDEGALASEIRAMKDMDIDLSGMGLEMDDLADLLADVPDVDLAGPLDLVEPEVDEPKTEPEPREPKPKDDKVPLAKAFDIKSVTPEQAELIDAFMADLEERHECRGLDALMEHIKGVAA